MNGIDIEVLMTSYVEDNTSQSKCWIFDSDSTIHVCSHKDMFNSLVAKEEGTVKIVDDLSCKVIDTGKSMLQVEMGLWCSGGGLCPRGMIQSNIIRVLDEEGC